MKKCRNHNIIPLPVKSSVTSWENVQSGLYTPPTQNVVCNMYYCMVTDDIHHSDIKLMYKRYTTINQNNISFQCFLDISGPTVSVIHMTGTPIQINGCFQTFDWYMYMFKSAGETDPRVKAHFQSDASDGSQFGCS